MPKKQHSYPIFMGDVVNSSDYDGKVLSKGLKELVESTNKKFGKAILSPLTITLGDEFQGILSSVSSGIDLLFHLEEELLRTEPDFKLHYVLLLGEIETEINPDIAYEMMGKGLTEARKMLSSKKRNRKRFRFKLQNKEQTEQLSRIFEVLDTIILNWKKEDYPLILNMINNDNNSEVGELHDKNRDQIWKRRKTLMINEYNLLKDFIKIYIK
ncbi:MAG: SatD family protein [Balneola sp.]